MKTKSSKTKKSNASRTAKAVGSDASLGVLKVGDKVEVLCEGLAMLRRLMPNMPPNHHGTVAEIWDSGEILVEFPLSGENHSQVAPYPKELVRLRSA